MDKRLITKLESLLNKKFSGSDWGRCMRLLKKDEQLFKETVIAVANGEFDIINSIGQFQLAMKKVKGGRLVNNRVEVQEKEQRRINTTKNRLQKRIKKEEIDDLFD